MPKLTLKIEVRGSAPIEASRKVENLRDVPKLFSDGQRSLKNAMRIFPSLRDAKIERVSVRTE